jgi:hypothetical protein
MANQNLGEKRAAEDNLLLAKRIRLNSSPDLICYGMVSILADCNYFISSIFAKSHLS